MHEKLLQQAIDLFDTQEKWDAFLELCYTKDTIRNRWRDALITRLKQRFAAIVLTDKWQFDERWPRIYPQGLLDQLEIRLNLTDRRGYLWVHKDFYDSVKVRNLIQNNPELISRLKEFEFHNDWDIWNKPFDPDCCTASWESSCYLWGHETERVAHTLFETYMHPFLTDELADYLTEVCEKTKRN